MKKLSIVFHNSLTWQSGIALNIGFVNGVYGRTATTTAINLYEP